MTVIQQEARATAIAFGVAAPDDLALALAQRIQYRLAGAQPYFCRESVLKRAEQDVFLQANFKGNNYAELAARVGLSERQVRRRLSPRCRPEKQ